jgi:hypothetical protein
VFLKKNADLNNERHTLCLSFGEGGGMNKRTKNISLCIGFLFYTFFIFMAGFMTSFLDEKKHQHHRSVSGEGMKKEITSFASGVAQTALGEFGQRLLMKSLKNQRNS